MSFAYPQSLLFSAVGAICSLAAAGVHLRFWVNSSHAGGGGFFPFSHRQHFYSDKYYHIAMTMAAFAILLSFVMIADAVVSGLAFRNSRK